MLKNIMWFLNLLIVRTHHLKYPITTEMKFDNGLTGIEHRVFSIGSIYEVRYVEWRTWLWFQWRVECYEYVEPPQHFNCRCELIMFDEAEDIDDSIFKQAVLGEFYTPEDELKGE